MDNNVFTVKNLSFAYGKQQVLKNLDLELHEGKITTLIGANGCGKSTLFHLMTKNLRPDEGEIFLRDGDIAGMRLKDFAKEVSIVHQYNTAPVDLSVEKLVGYGRTPYHTMGLSPDPKEDEEKIRRALEITHTWKHRDKPVSEPVSYTHLDVYKRQVKTVSAESMSSGKKMEGRVNKMQYLYDGEFRDGGIDGRYVYFPVTALNFIAMGKGRDTLLHGSVCLKMQCSVGDMHMPESAAIFTMFIH